MITIHNYFEERGKLDFSTMPKTFANNDQFLIDMTESGANWETYNEYPDVKKTADLYLCELNSFLSGNKLSSCTEPQKKKKENSERQKVKKEVSNPAPKRKSEKAQDINPVNTNEFVAIPVEINFIRSFLKLNGKHNPNYIFTKLLRRLQKAIVEKKIRKTSTYIEPITTIQNTLVRIHNANESVYQLNLRKKQVLEYEGLIKSAKTFPSLNFIKRFLTIVSKSGEEARKKTTSLQKAIQDSIETEKLTKDDPYYFKVLDIQKKCSEFLSSKSKSKVLEMEEQELNGLMGILGCNCRVSSLGNFPEVMNSMDVANLHFQTIGLRGKWREFIGDPAPGFTAMVFGPPKCGKTTLCLDFGSDLAEHHGKVLFSSIEEGITKTLQDKIKNRKHPNLSISRLLSENLEPYDFIFVDSVNRYGLTPEDLQKLKDKWPNKSFIFIFQVTKAGKFRGNNNFQHDVDIVIEVPQPGKAIQRGRYNGYSEMDISFVE